MLPRFKQALSRLLLAQVENAARTLHIVALGVYVGLSEDDPLQTYLESGPSLFCSCCGERWHSFSRASCPNGCPWIYATFRAPAWAEDRELLERIQERHKGRMQAIPGGTPKHDRWPTSDGKIPRA
jgi:hypothetical protein